MSSDSVNNNNNNMADLSGALSSLNIIGDVELASACANCGQEGDGDNMNACNKCDLAKYCNAACKKKHRSKHKKACVKRVAELYDEKLFKDHPPPEDCPICFLPLPLDNRQVVFESCCGKMICSGCVYAMAEREGAELCAFCRTPCAESEKEYVKRLKKLMEKGNGRAVYVLGAHYADGTLGLPQNRAKANELHLKAGELGCADAYFSMGSAYDDGRDVEVDTKKAKYYYEMAAMNDCIPARHNLGVIEGNAGNIHRALKHFILAAKASFGCS